MTHREIFTAIVKQYELGHNAIYGSDLSIAQYP